MSDDSSERCSRVIAHGPRPIRCRASKISSFATRRLRRGEVEFKLDIETERTQEIERPFQEPGGRAIVGTPKCATACIGKPLACPHRELSIRLAEIIFAAGSLLEVIRNDLVWGVAVGRGFKPVRALSR